MISMDPCLRDRNALGVPIEQDFWTHSLTVRCRWCYQDLHQIVKFIGGRKPDPGGQICSVAKWSMLFILGYTCIHSFQALGRQVRGHDLDISLLHSVFSSMPQADDPTHRLSMVSKYFFLISARTSWSCRTQLEKIIVFTHAWIRFFSFYCS